MNVPWWRAIAGAVRQACRSRGFKIIAALLVAVTVLIPAGAARAALPEPGQSGPPPVLNINNQPAQYATALQNFENNAVSQVLATHNLPSSDAAAVLGWGRDDVRAQEWADLAEIIGEPAASRSANDQTVYQWFQSVYAAEQVAQAQDAINEYLKWSGGATLTSPPVNFGSGDTGYCNYAPPGGSGGPFAGSYTGNTDQTCFTPCTQVLGCSTPYPTIAQFQAWGEYDALNKEVVNSDFANSSLGTTAALSIGASLGAAGIITPLSAAFGGAGISPAFVSEIFPFAARVAWQSAASITADGLSAGSDATEVAAAAGAEAAGAIAFVVGVAIFFIVSTVFAILQLVQNADIPTELASALSSAQADTSPDLGGALSDSSTAPGLYVAFLAQTMPDVDYACSSASTDPCADAPTPPGPQGTDPLFEVATTSNGITTTTLSPTIYTVDQRNPDFISSRLSGNGWFVSTRYNGADPANLNAPTDAPGTTFQSLQFFYTDWQGNHWAAERIEDSAGNPEFAISPMDASNAGACATGNTTANGACITPTLDIQTPNGTDQTVTVVPVSAVLPSLAANVPPEITTGQPAAFSATGTDPNNLPLSYSWTVYCPGSAPGFGFPCFGGANGSFSSTLTGASVQFSAPSPGAFTAYVTATDADAFSVTRHFTVNSVAATTTAVTANQASPENFGQPASFTATVTPQNCQCFFSQIPLAPAGSVQFYDNSVALGAPVPVALSGSPNAAGNDFATATTPQLTLGPGSHAITATYVPSGAADDDFGSALGPTIQPGFSGSQGSTTFQVSQVASSSTVAPASTGTAVVGEPLTFTDTVTPAAGTGTPTGWVQFSVDGTAVGPPVALGPSGQVTSPQITGLAAGGHTVTASYSGDAGYTPSTSQTLTFQVASLATTTTVTAAPGPGTQGGTVTFTATVTPASSATAAPTGTVTFRDGSTVLGTATLTPGTGKSTAAFSTSSLKTGPHQITAAYAGDAGHTASISPAVTEIVDTSLSGYPKLKNGDYNLTGAKLAGAYLSDLTLTGAILSLGNFQNAVFDGSNVTQALMAVANFAGASFVGANLTKATMGASNFKNANFTGANLTGAILLLANLTGVTWSNTTCPDGTNSSNDKNTCIGHLVPKH